MVANLLTLPRTIWRNRRESSATIEPPRFLTYTVTFTCNARCVMCDSWKKSGEGDLSLTDVDRIFRQLPRLDAVRLTGGEPFVRKDMVGIAELVKAYLRPAFLHVTTNGFLTDRIVEFCEQRPRQMPLQLLVSIDGFGAKHDAVRGHRHAWSSAVRTLEALAPRRKELGLSLAVNQTVIDAEGAEHYGRLRDFLAPLGIHNQVVVAYQESATYSVQSEVDVAPTAAGQFSTFGSFTPQQLIELLDEVEADLSSRPLFERMAKRYYLQGIRNRLLGRGANPNPRCVALRSHLRLFPNGDVPTCQFNTKVVGNLRDQSFVAVWQSVRAAEQRRWVAACPGCWAECEVLPSAIYTGDLLRPVRR